ncbi:divergent PAP2 family protein [Patescibacteria group bacterium]|nr:divergent PAP2 family protein [Patescibacteria group bacterium]
MADFKFFIIPLLVLCINQIIKLLVHGFQGNFSWGKIFSYGGMPSSHTALATSLVLVIGYFEGWASVSFAIALIMAIVIVKDAAGIRRKLGKQAQIINQMTKKMPSKEKYKFPVLNERFGHTNTEIIVGMIIGIVLTMLLIYTWPK